MKTLHEAYGLTEDTRKAVLATAAEQGVAAAAQLHGVSKMSVYNWRRWYGATEAA